LLDQGLYLPKSERLGSVRVYLPIGNAWYNGIWYTCDRESSVGRVIMRGKGVHVASLLNFACDSAFWYSNVLEAS
jgi:hypothetical protein